MDDEHELRTAPATWITGIKGQFRSVRRPTREPEVQPEPFGFKML